MFYNLKITALIFFVTLIKSSLSDVYRLPNNVRPTRYILTVEPNLDPDLNPAPYNGSVTILLKVYEDTKNITFNIRRLSILESSIKVTDSHGGYIPVVGTENDPQLETFTVRLEQALKKGENYSLEIGSFSGNLGRANVGFYLATYVNAEKQVRRLAVTDFEPDDARQAFPCFDEPGIKSTFVINLIRKKEYNSLSNEELEKTIDLGNGRYQDVYKETPKMPVYVVAFVISDFEGTNLTERHRIFARPGAVAQGKVDYCLDISVKTLQALEEFTGVKFPINKMDQFAIPDEYFKDDAMENFALVIYGESHLFCTNQSAYEDLRRCTTYIAHEFGHQWFGNLVTPAWWTYTWLSESFAGYLQFYIASLVQPTWRLMDQFVVENLHGALDRDNSGRHAKTLNFEITYNGQFPYLWILYHKGASIIRMTEHFMTHNVFKKGLQTYLEDKKYEAAEPKDLYAALQKAIDNANSNHLLGNHKIDEILHSWDSNGGYPVVTITRNYQTGSLTFQQKRFVNHDGDDDDSVVHWYIPINFAFSSDKHDKFAATTADFWLSKQNKTIEKNFTTQGWLLANIQQTGYYRVNYDLENWERLIKALNSDEYEKIPVLNRAQLLDDAFDLARARKLSFDIAFRLSEYLIKEKDYIPFVAFFSFIDHMEFVLPYQEETTDPTKFMFFGNYSLQNIVVGKYTEYELFREYVKYILEPTYKRLGFYEKQTDTILEKVFRAKVAKWLCDNKYTQCINDAVQALSQFKHNDTDFVPPNMRYIIFCRGVDSIDDWNFLAKLYKESTSNAIKRDIYDALSCNHRYGSRKSLKS